MFLDEFHENVVYTVGAESNCVLKWKFDGNLITNEPDNEVILLLDEKH